MKKGVTDIRVGLFDTLRTCNRCGKQKPLDEFHRNPACTLGHVGTCKVCTEADGKANKAANPERVKSYSSQWAKDPSKLPNRLCAAARSRAKLWGIEFRITPLDVVVPERCPLLGIVLKKSVGGKAGPASPSLDRIDNRFGYIPGNVWVISYRANVMKSDATFDEIETLVHNLRIELERRGLVKYEPAT